MRRGTRRRYRDHDQTQAPIGVQTFRKVREQDCYYVDKTATIRSLVDDGTHYFLSRPRRFGKSLLLDTMRELFEGNRALFEGLAVHDRWDWSVRHPVLRLDFGSGSYRQAGGLHEDVMAQLDDAAEAAGVESRYDSAPVRFRHLIAALRRQAGQPVVVLVDEYDKPILDALDDPETARANRDYLGALYSAIKSSDATTPTTSCCSSTAAASKPGGSRPAPRRSSFARCASGTSAPPRSASWSPAATCSRRSTWGPSPLRRCCSRPAI